MAGLPPRNATNSAFTGHGGAHGQGPAHAGHHPHGGPHRNGSAHPHTVHDDHHRPRIRFKFRPGLYALAWLQFIGGLLVLNFEAISSVMYRASESDILHGVEFAGLYVSVFTMATGIIGMLAIRKHASLRMRMCCFAIDIIMTIFLAVQTFAMCCASGAMLAFHTISWDTVLNFVNRVSLAADLNLSVGTSTTTQTPTLVPSMVEAELLQDHNLLVGLRCILFVIYFTLFATSVLGSCLSCCNYCKCWAGNDQARAQDHESLYIEAGRQPAATTHISAITTAGPQSVIKEVKEVTVAEKEAPTAGHHSKKSGHKSHHSKEHKS